MRQLCCGTWREENRGNNELFRLSGDILLTDLDDEAAVGLCVEAAVGHVGLGRVGGHPGDAAVGGADAGARAALLQVAGAALFP